MYTYDNLSDDLAYLAFNGVDGGCIGKSELGCDIPYVHIGDYHGKQIIITAGIHARENVTSLLAMRLAYSLAFGTQVFDGGIYILPMINPDGALLIQKGACVCPQNAARLIEINGGEDFSLWKANINGVDLNNNFDARFGLGVGQKAAPSSQGYHGEYPLSQAESAALARFTLKIRPALTLSYHALGREVYWQFFQNPQDEKRDKEIAQSVANHLGYTLVDGDAGSTGGYKDWCIQKLKIPALTVEIISPSHTHPLDASVLDEDWQQNKDIPALLAKLIN